MVYGSKGCALEFGEAGMNGQLEIFILKKYFHLNLVRLDVKGQTLIFN